MEWSPSTSRRPTSKAQELKWRKRTASAASFARLVARPSRSVARFQPYYPWWQGSINDLRENLIRTAREYNKDIIVVEAAYNWTPAIIVKGILRALCDKHGQDIAPSQ